MPTGTDAVDGIQALLFDVFGTVVDWREGVASAAESLLLRHAPTVGPRTFADAWRAQYQPSMERVRSGNRPFVRLDVLHRENVDTTLATLAVDPDAIPDAELNELTLAWHRLEPWPDVVEGLSRLRHRFIIAPLSNANIRLALDMAKRAGLPWDAILGAEVVQAYKPSPEAYLRTAEVLALQPHQVALVAAHNNDLAAARDAGLRTVFVPRPHEHGPDQHTDLDAEQNWDLIAEDFTDLADKLIPQRH